MGMAQKQAMNGPTIETARFNGSEKIEPSLYSISQGAPPEHLSVQRGASEEIFVGHGKPPAGVKII